MKASGIAIALALAGFANIESGLAVAADWRSPLVGGPGGGNFTLYCNTNSYLAGLRVRAGDDVDAISPICGQLLPSNGRGQLSYYHKAGGNGGDEQDLLCPPQAPFVRQLYIQGQGIDTVLVAGLSLRCGPVAGPMPTELEGHNYFRVSTWHVDTGLKHNEKQSFVCPDANTAFTGLVGRAGAFVDALGVVCGALASAAQPAPFQPSATEWFSHVGGGSGGGPFATRCPGNAYLAGFNVRTGDDVDAIGPICATALRNGERGKLFHQPQVGGSGGYLREMRCPSHIPFVRQVGATWEGVDTQLVNGLGFVCGKIGEPVPAPVMDQNFFGFRLHVRTYSSFRPNSEGGGNTFNCPDGMSFTGLHGRAGAMVDALGVICDNTRFTLSSVGKKRPPPPVLSGTADGRAQDIPDIEAAPPILNSTVSGETSRSREQIAMREDAAATQEHGTAMVDPSVKSALNPQPLPPRTTTLQPREATVLHPGPMQATSAEKSSVNPQAPIQGTATSNATGLAADTAAQEIETVEMVCRGGDGLRIENKGAKQNAGGGSSALIHLVFSPAFPLRNASGTYPPAGRQGDGLTPSSCSFADREFTASDPQLIVFEAALQGSALIPGETATKRMLHDAESDPSKLAEVRADEKSIPEYLSNPANYWSFKVYRTNYGHVVATTHGPWNPLSPQTAIAGTTDAATKPQQVMRFTRIRIDAKPRRVAFRFNGPPDSTPELLVFKGPVKPTANGGGSWDGPAMILKAVKVSDAKPSEVAEFYASSIEHGRPFTADARLEFVAGAQYHYFLSDKGSSTRQEGTFTTQATTDGVGVASSAQGGIPSNLFELEDRAILEVGGKQTTAGRLKRELRAQLRQESGAPRPLKTASRLPATQIAGTAEGSANLTKYAAPATASQSALQQAQVATVRSSSPAGSLSSHSGPIAGVATNSKLSDPGLQVDCAGQAPRILQVREGLRSGQPFTIEGTCLGRAHGTIELIGLPTGKAIIPFSSWNENSIVAAMPPVSGVQDQRLTLAVVRNPDRRSSPPREVTFVAARELVRVSAERWSPSARWRKSELQEGSYRTVNQMQRLERTYQVRVQIDPACALHAMGAVPSSGVISAIRGWDSGPPHQGDVSIDWRPWCITKKEEGAFGPDVTVFCEVDFILETTAYCPAGMKP